MKRGKGKRDKARRTQKNKTEGAPNGGENKRQKTGLLCRGLTMKFMQQKALQKGGYRGYKRLLYTDISNNKEQKTLQGRVNQTTTKNTK